MDSEQRKETENKRVTDLPVNRMKRSWDRYTLKDSEGNKDRFWGGVRALGVRRSLARVAGSNQLQTVKNKLVQVAKCHEHSEHMRQCGLLLIKLRFGLLLFRIFNTNSTFVGL